jgi:hypothetical protein
MMTKLRKKMIKSILDPDQLMEIDY